MLSALLRNDLEAALGSAIRGATRLGGGCISNATRIDTEDDRRLVAKWGSRGEFHDGLFAAEADALEVLAQGDEVRVPRVLGLRDEGGEFSWLLLEWLPPGRATAAGWEGLGRSLAELHRRSAPHFGWSAANFIGALPQSNAQTADWPAFWAEQRIAPHADVLDSADRRRIDALLDHADALLSAGNEEGASLLHGDLWGGNVHPLADGSCALIDPSIYYGHREVDLAMATLFGGFHDSFFDAYNESWPLLPGWEQRRHFYQLYYMLVHVRLFGSSYLGGTRSLLSKLGF